MNEMVRGTLRAVSLICNADPAVLEIIWLTLTVTGLALAVSTVIGVPAGAALGLWSRMRVRGLITVLLYTGMGLPPVVVGLAVYLLLSRSGPLGGWGWLFTPRAMVLAQIVIALPVVAGLTMTAVQSVDPALRLQVRALGATRWQELAAVLREAWIGVMAAIVAAFGSIISEVGAVMLVGGNIERHTRVLTTAIVLNTRMGEFDVALALGIILLLLTFLANTALFWLQQRAEV
jgi:tungstate transport system permease protein